MSTRHCLFDLWRTTAPPLLHTSEFWPSFDQTAVQNFFHGKADGPTPTRSANVAAVREAQKNIQQFLDAVAKLDTKEYPCKPAYEAFEADRLTTLQLILSADDPAAAAAANDHLYGTGEALRRGEVLAYLKQFVAVLQPRSPRVAKGREILLNIWEDVPAQDTLTPIFYVLEQWRRQLRPLVAKEYGAMQTLLDPYASAPALDAETTQQIVEAALQTLLGPSDWRAICQPHIPNAFIDYTRRAVVLPTGRKYHFSHVQTLIMHEIGVHVRRSRNGEQSREPLAAFGLAGYAPMEEAFGVLVGSAHVETFGYEYSLVPLAVVDFAARSHNFRAVWRAAKALLMCLDNGAQKDYDRIAFTRTIRALRFGTGTFAERSATKYWRGLLLLNDYFAQHGCTQDSFNDFFMGKYDPTSPSQRRLLEKHV